MPITFDPEIEDFAQTFADTEIPAEHSGTGAAGDSLIVFLWVQDTGVTVTDLQGFTVVHTATVSSIYPDGPAGQLYVLHRTRPSSAAVSYTFQLSASVDNLLSLTGNWPPGDYTDWATVELDDLNGGSDVPFTASFEADEPGAACVVSIGPTLGASLTFPDPTDAVDNGVEAVDGPSGYANANFNVFAYEGPSPLNAHIDEGVSGDYRFLIYSPQAAVTASWVVGWR